MYNLPGITEPIEQLDQIDNKITDLLRKLSRKLISMLPERGVDTVVTGQLKGIREGANYGSQMNQRWTSGHTGNLQTTLSTKPK